MTFEKTIWGQKNNSKLKCVGRVASHKPSRSRKMELYFFLISANMCVPGMHISLCPMNVFKSTKAIVLRDVASTFFKIIIPVEMVMCHKTNFTYILLKILCCKIFETVCQPLHPLPMPIISKRVEPMIKSHSHHNYISNNSLLSVLAFFFAGLPFFLKMEAFLATLALNTGAATGGGAEKDDGCEGGGGSADTGGARAVTEGNDPDGGGPELNREDACGEATAAE